MTKNILQRLALREQTEGNPQFPEWRTGEPLSWFIRQRHNVQ